MKTVVSGIGLVTPLGQTRESTWEALLLGRSAIQKGPHGLEAVVSNFSANGARSRMGDFAVMAAREALAHAGLYEKTIGNRRVGCAVSQSKPVLSEHSMGCHPGESRDPGCEPVFWKNVKTWTVSRNSPVDDRNHRNGIPAFAGMTDRATAFPLNPALLLSSFFGWSSEAVIKRELGLNGPSANVTAACATGIASIEVGAHWIKTNQCDAVLVGASESSLHELYRSGFKQMGVLAEGDEPTAICPFDKKRSGFSMGEGAAVLVLESEKSARERGHKPLASLLNIKMRHSSCDSLRFDPEGASISQLIQYVMKEFPEPDYINAHGTGTVFNDVAETKGIKRAFSSSAQKIPVSSTKAATGHLLGAAGAVEAVFCVLALRDNIMPPTLHLNNPDPECDLDYVPKWARRSDISRALSLSYGFGGQMGAVLFGRC